MDMTTDVDGNIYVTGTTGSRDLPTKHAAQSRYEGSDAFVAKFDPSGRRLVYASFLGGPCGRAGKWDAGNAIAVDRSGNAYVAGETWSHDFPTTADAFKPEMAWDDEGDAFVAKLGPGGTLKYSTYLGGSRGLGGIGGNLTGDDGAEGIAVDGSGNAYVTGYTDAKDFPVATPVQSEPAGGYDAFVTIVDPTGSRLLFSTYLGGEDDDDRGGEIAVASAGRIVVAGITGSETFPTTPRALQGATGDAAGDDAFVARIDVSRNVVDYATYLGGVGTEEVEDLVVGSDGSAFVAGATYSNDFPVTAAAFQRRSGGSRDAFVARVGPAGSRLAFSTYLGGAADDSAKGLALAVGHSLYVVGHTASRDFPIRRPIQRANAGGHDMFAARLSPAGTTIRWSTYLGGTGRSILPQDVATAVSARRASLVVAGFARAQRLRCCTATEDPRHRIDGLLVVVRDEDRATSRSGRPRGFRTPSTSRRSS